jgi:hypothetical protein
MAQNVAASGSTIAMNVTSTATKGVVDAKDAVVAYHVATVQPLLSAGLGYASIWAGSGLVHLRGGVASGMTYINKLSAQMLELSRAMWAESFKRWSAFSSEMSGLAFDEFLRRNQVCHHPCRSRLMMTTSSLIWGAIWISAAVTLHPTRDAQVGILTASATLVFAALLRGGVMARRAIADGPREFVSSKKAEEDSFKVFSAFKHAGFRSGDCIGEDVQQPM